MLHPFIIAIVMSLGKMEVDILLSPDHCWFGILGKYLTLDDYVLPFGHNSLVSVTYSAGDKQTVKSAWKNIFVDLYDFHGTGQWSLSQCLLEATCTSGMNCVCVANGKHWKSNKIFVAQYNVLRTAQLT